MSNEIRTDNRTQEQIDYDACYNKCAGMLASLLNSVLAGRLGAMLEPLDEADARHADHALFVTAIESLCSHIAATPAVGAGLPQSVADLAAEILA